MVVLQIEHQVPNFEGWKKAFDSDPIDRQKSGVRTYRVYRSADDPGNVIIDLEFDNAEKAEAMLTALQNLWNQVEGTVITGPKARILNIIESQDYTA